MKWIYLVLIVLAVSTALSLLMGWAIRKNEEKTKLHMRLWGGAP